jgi:hypothetical protein
MYLMRFSMPPPILIANQACWPRNTSLNPSAYLVASGLADQPTPMPWFGGKTLALRFA